MHMDPSSVFQRFVEADNRRAPRAKVNVMASTGSLLRHKKKMIGLKHGRLATVIYEVVSKRVD